MKLVSFDADGKARVGVLVRDGTFVVDVQAAEVAINRRPYKPFRTMQSLKDDGVTGMSRLRDIVAKVEAGQVPDALMPVDGVHLIE
jgi:hypothetical protein